MSVLEFKEHLAQENQCTFPIPMPRPQLRIGDPDVSFGSDKMDIQGRGSFFFR